MSRQTNPVDRIVHTFVIIMVAFLTLGMGILGEEVPTDIPEPAGLLSYSDRPV